MKRLLTILIISVILNSVGASSARAQWFWSKPKEETKQEVPAVQRSEAMSSAMEQVAVEVEEPAVPAQQPKAPAKKKAAVSTVDKRALIDEDIRKGNLGLAKKELKDILVSGDAPHLNDWAARTLYLIAKKEGSVTQVITELQARDPGNNPGLKRAIAEGYVRLKDWKEVERIYEGLAVSEPDDPVVATRLIDYHILAGEPEKAIAKLEPKVTANPEDKYNSDLLLDAYVAAGMKDKALALFKKRVDAAPGSPGLRGRYAKGLEDLGMLNEALKEYQKAAELDPSNRYFQMKVRDVSSRIGG